MPGRKHPWPREDVFGTASITALSPRMAVETKIGVVSHISGERLHKGLISGLVITRNRSIA
jgi:hypothetical protein